MLIRYKLVFLSLVLVLLGTGCSDEVKPKDSSEEGPAVDPCADSGSDKYLCLDTALQQIDPVTQQPIDPETECAKVPGTALCGKYKFINDGYGGFVYPQPVLNFFNDMYSHYVSYHHGANGVMPPFRHFGELFGLIYNDNLGDIEPNDVKPENIDAALLPVGIVAGGNDAYKSESCAMCHFGIANDGFYRFGVANTHLKYGGLKLAFNRFVCYAEAQNEYADLSTKCASTVDISTLAEPEKTQCAAYQAFLTSNGNASLLGLWQNAAIFSDDKRAQLLDGLKNAVPNSANACTAVGQLLPAYSYDQIIELSKWDGVRVSNTSVVDADASRMDRFYHSTVTGTEPINDGVHAPVKIPVLGNLVPEGALTYEGLFVGSGVVSSLQHYVRVHTALVGGDNTAADVQNPALEPLMKFLAGLKLPVPVVSQTALDSPEYKEGKLLFEQRCATCHVVTSTLDQPLVPYTTDVGTDFTYALMLNAGSTGVVTPPMGLSSEWGTPSGMLKPPHLQGLWSNETFLHNGMVYSLENLFCLTGNRAQRSATDSEGNMIHKAPFLDDGHRQTCAADLDDTQRRRIINYLLTL